MKEKIRSYIFNPGFILIVIFCIIFFTDGLNAMQHQLIGYDEGYNATVAANQARHGEYRVSYPFEIPFYNMITTGVPVLLPTAVLYRAFGINYITSGIVPLIYMTLSIIVLWIAISKCFENSKAGKFTASMLVLFLIISDKLIPIISTRLLGEGACILFLALAWLLMAKGYSSKNNIPFFGAGFFVITTFLTKSATIFFLVSLIGIILFEAIIRNIKISNAISFLMGLVGGFIVVDAFKFRELEGYERWADWWHMEWGNMLDQSGQIAEMPTFNEKFAYLSEIFGTNKYVALFSVLLPVLTYLAFLILKLRKKPINMDNATYCGCLLAIAGSSLEIFYILFGGGGLSYERRHAVNEVFVKVFSLVLIGKLVLWLISKAKEKNYKYICALAAFSVLTIYAIVALDMPGSVKNYIVKQHEDDYDLVLMREFLSEIDEISPDAKLYCNGWWQEPDISLFLDRDFEDLSELDPETVDTTESYFFIGRRSDTNTAKDAEDSYGIKLERVNDIQVDYNDLNGYNSNELFSIYRISSK